MPVDKFKHNLIKISKQQHRNPIYLAKEWRKALDNCEYDSLAAIARHFNITRARVTQIMNLFKLTPEVIEIISSLGDPISSLIVTERGLRPSLALTAEQQMDKVKDMFDLPG